MKLSKYIYVSQPLRDSDGNLNNKVFIFSTRSSLSILITKDALEKLKARNFSAISPDLFNKLEKYKVLVPENEDEFAVILEENERMKSQSDVLSLTIQPTANCQFGCHYCGQEHVNHQMDGQVEEFCLNRIRNMLGTTPRYKKLAITWYGGEPLLGLSVIRRLSSNIQGLCKEYGLKYRSEMVTNGYLLKKEIFLTLLLEHKVKNFQITLDGISKTHDQRRVLKVNRGKTFDIIYNNIKEIVRLPEYKTENAHIQIRINIDKTNYREVDELLDKFVNDGIADKVVMSFAPIENWGGNDAGKASFSHAEFSMLYMHWMRFCIEHHIQTSALIPHRKSASCMVESKHNEVIDAYGNTYPCWEFPYSSYKGEEYKIASLDNPLGQKSEDASLANIIERVKNGRHECSGCIFYPMCAGGCALALHEKRNACPTYKYDLGQRLLLDYQIRNSK